MLNAVEKLYSSLVRLGSLIINVLATLKCVGLQKIYARWRWSPRSLLPIQIHVKFHSTLGGLHSPGPRSLTWVSSKSILTIFAVHGISAKT